MAFPMTPGARGLAKTVSVVRDPPQVKPAATMAQKVQAAFSGDPLAGPQVLDANRDAWANALDTMSGVRTPDPITALAKIGTMGLAGYQQGKAIKAKEQGSAAYKQRLATALSGKADNATLMGLYADPYADPASQQMAMKMWERNNPTAEEQQRQQLLALQYQQAQQALEQNRATFNQQQQEIARQNALRGGRQDAVEGFDQNFTQQGGDLFSPQMQAMLRQNGIDGVSPQDSIRHQQMQPYMNAGDYENAFQQMTAPAPQPEYMTVGKGDRVFNKTYGNFEGGQSPEAATPDWKETTLEDGVYWVDQNNPQTRIKIGDRPNRNEGEGRGFTQEKQLRGEYMNESKPFTDLRTNYQRIQASSQDQTGASDIALVYSFMKMLDPTSVVREGEFATAANAGGVDSKIMSLYNNVINGQKLSPQIRKEFQQQAARQYQQQITTYGKVQQKYKDLAAKLGLDPANVAPDLVYGVQPQNPGDQQSPPPAQGIVTLPSDEAQADAIYNQLPSGAQFRGPDGQVRRKP